MMENKNRFSILVLVLIVILIGCKTDSKKPLGNENVSIDYVIDSNTIKHKFLVNEGLKRIPYFDTTSTKGRVKSLTRTKFGIKSMFGEMVKGEQRGYKTQFEFDEKGFISKIVNYDETGDVVKKITFSFNDSLQELKTKEFNREGILTVESLRSYNDKNLLLNETWRSFSVVNRYSYDYDENDRLLLSEYTDDKGELFYRYKYRYTFEHYEPYGSRGRTGSEIVKIQYGSNGKELYRWVSEFDDNGNIISTYSPDSETAGLVKKRNLVNYTYYNKGFIHSIERDGETKKFTYDSLNNIKRLTIYRGDDSFPLPPLDFYYEFDEKGNWVIKKGDIIEERNIEY